MVNRMAEFTPPVPRLRSAAQRQASKQNGARSRGPKTAAGRERSRANALKHGLFAKQIMPPGDYRERDVLFGEIRRQLMLEFSPSTFSQITTVDSLASDYLSLALALQMTEASLPIRDLPQRDAERWKALTEAKENLQLVTMAMERCRGDGLVALPAAKAQRLADYLGRHLASVEKDLAELSDPELDPLTAIDVELRIPQAKLVEALGASRQRVSAPAYLLSLLDGTIGLTPRSRKHLLAILQYAKAMGERYIMSHDQLEVEVARSQQECTALAGRQIQSLALFQRYQADLQRAIDRKLRRLGSR